MSWEAFATVRDIVTATGSRWCHVDRLVALAIADHLGAKGTAWPSRRRIGRWTGLGEATIKRAVHRLCSGPARIFDREPGGSDPGGRRRASTFSIADRSQCDPGQSGPGSGRAPDRGHSEPRPGSERAPKVLRTSQRTSEPVARRSRDEQELAELESDADVMAVAAEFCSLFERERLTTSGLTAIRRALDAGATVLDLGRITRAAWMVREHPARAPEKGLIRWAIREGKVEPGFLFDPPRLEKFRAEAAPIVDARPVVVVENANPYADRPLDEVPFHERKREAERRRAAGAA